MLQALTKVICSSILLKIRIAPL